MEQHETQYIVNPDVSCREESLEGALLFNPDTDDVLVVNITGLVIWQTLVQPRTRPQVVEALLVRCEDVPTDEVRDDVDTYLNQLVERGYVGIYQGMVK